MNGYDRVIWRHFASITSQKRKRHRWLIIALLSSIEWGEHWILEQRILTEAFWILLVAMGFGIYITAKVRERHGPTLNTVVR